MSNANMIEPWRFCAEKIRLERTFLLSELDSRVDEYAHFGSMNDSVTLVLQGQIDEHHQHWIHLHLTGTVSPQCQRCLMPVSINLDEKTRILLCENEEQAEQIDLEDDDVEIVGLQETIDIRVWVEDLIITALPMAPCHEQCGDEDLTAQYKNQKDNPFAVLENL
ncbi:MAG: DUF177 domain-containing protein [Neisseriaceae bacterium]|nr:DUF177 domain-containing protein [Neisseriaceae bacterium]